MKVAGVRVRRKCNEAVGEDVRGPASPPLGGQMEESQCVLKYSCAV